MNFSPTYVLESKTCPGVLVTLRRMGPRLRAATELSVSAARSNQRRAIQDAERAGNKLQDALTAIAGFREAIAALPHDENGSLIGVVTPEIVAMFTPEAWELSAAKAACESERDTIGRATIDPAFVKAAVKSISGLESDGIPYTADMLCDAGPAELFDEIVKAINSNAYATLETAENLSLPSTSGAQVDGGTSNTIAPIVN